MGARGNFLEGLRVGRIRLFVYIFSIDLPVEFVLYAIAVD